MRRACPGEHAWGCHPPAVCTSHLQGAGRGRGGTRRTPLLRAPGAGWRWQGRARAGAMGGRVCGAGAGQAERGASRSAGHRCAPGGRGGGKGSLLGTSRHVSAAPALHSWHPVRIGRHRPLCKALGARMASARGTWAPHACRRPARQGMPTCAARPCAPPLPCRRAAGAAALAASHAGAGCAPLLQRPCCRCCRRHTHAAEQRRRRHQLGRGSERGWPNRKRFGSSRGSGGGLRGKRPCGA